MGHVEEAIYTIHGVEKCGSWVGWDDVKKTVAGDDDWWNVHLKEHPKNAKYKKNEPANLEEMHVMFAKAHVTGATSSIHGEILDNTNDDDMVDCDVEYEEDEKDVTVSPKDGKVVLCYAAN